MGRPPPCDAGVGTLNHRKKAATRLRWRRRRLPITRPGPPPARRSPSPVGRVGRLQGFWAEDANKRSRRRRAWRNRADEMISGPTVSHCCHAQPPAPAAPVPGALPSRTHHTPFSSFSFCLASLMAMLFCIVTHTMGMSGHMVRGLFLWTCGLVLLLCRIVAARQRRMRLEMRLQDSLDVCVLILRRRVLSFCVQRRHICSTLTMMRVMKEKILLSSQQTQHTQSLFPSLAFWE